MQRHRMNGGFEVKDRDRNELVDPVKVRAQKTHNMKEIPPDMAEEINKAIRVGYLT